MPPDNIKFVNGLYPGINMGEAVVLYNWLSDIAISKDSDDIKKKFNIENKVLCLYGGNIGLGQRMENIVNISYYCEDKPNVAIDVVRKGIEMG